MEVKPRTLDKGSLWLLTIAPTIWAAHLLLSYVTAAIWCARYADRNDPLNGIHTAITWYTVVALLGITIIGWEGFRRHTYSSTSGGTEATTHDLDSPDDRHRFLGFATLLLSGLSAVAVMYAALAATYFDTCR
jgi:hypothetical protein